MSAHVGDAPLTFDNLVFTEIYVQAAGAWKLVVVHFQPRSVTPRRPPAVYCSQKQEERCR